MEPILSVQLKHFYGNSDQITCATFSSDLQILITGSDDTILRIFKLVTGKLIVELISHKAPIRSLAISDDCRLFASGDFSSRLLLFTLRNATCAFDYKGHSKSIECVTFSPHSGDYLLSGSWDHTAVLHCTRTGNTMMVFKDHINLVQSLCFSKDSSLIATGSWDYCVRVYNITSKLENFRSNHRTIAVKMNATHDRVLKGHKGNIYCVAFSTSGLLASGSWDKHIFLWNVNTESCIYVLKGHTGWVNSLCFSYDGLRLLTTSEDGSVRIWDCICGTQSQILKGRTDAVSQCVLKNETIIILGYNHSQIY